MYIFGNGMKRGYIYLMLIHRYILYPPPPDLETFNDWEIFEKTAATYNLHTRGTHGEQAHIKGGILDLNHLNRYRLGITEYEAVMSLQKGVIELIRLE